MNYTKEDINKKIKNLNELIVSYEERILQFTIEKDALNCLIIKFDKNKDYTNYMRLEEDKRMFLEDD